MLCIELRTDHSRLSRSRFPKIGEAGDWRLELETGMMPRKLEGQRDQTLLQGRCLLPYLLPYIDILLA